MVTAVAGTVGAVFLAWIAWQQRKLQQTTQAVSDKTDLAVVKADQTAVKVAQVAIDLKVSDQNKNDKLDNIADLSVKNHMLLNSGLGKELELSAESAQFKANATGLPEDVAAAALQARKLADHRSRQARVDENENRQ